MSQKEQEITQQKILGNGEGNKNLLAETKIKDGLMNILDGKLNRDDISEGKIRLQKLEEKYGFLKKFVYIFPEEDRSKVVDELFVLVDMVGESAEILFKFGLPSVKGLIERKIVKWPQVGYDLLEIIKHLNNRYIAENFFLFYLSQIEWLIEKYPRKWPKICYELIEFQKKVYNGYFLLSLPSFKELMEIEPIRWVEILCDIESLINEARDIFEDILISEDSLLDTIFIVYENFLRVLLSIFRQNIKKRENIKVFLKYVVRRKDNLIVLKDVYERGLYMKLNFTEIMSYLLEYKKKEIIPFLKRLIEIEDLDLGIDIARFKFKSLEDIEKEVLDDFREKGVEFNKRKVEEEIKEKVIAQYKRKLLTLQKESYIKSGEVDRKIKEVERIFKVYKNDKNKLEEEFKKKWGEILYKCFDYLFIKKLKLNIKKFLKEQILKKNKDIDKVLNENLNFFESEIFIEFYKIIKSSVYNSTQGKQLLARIIKGLNEKKERQIPVQYDTKNNRKWLEKNLTQQQIEIWLSPNRKEFEINYIDSENKEQDVEKRIKHHYEIAIQKIKILNENYQTEYDTNFRKYGDLLNYFDKKIKKEEESIEDEKRRQIFEDLKLQIDSIKKLLQKRKIKRIKKIIIERELDPLKIAMMGNWVEGSCLSYYSPLGTYGLVIAYIVEVNKAVFYLKDEDGEIIGRVLLAMDDDGNLIRFPMYYGKRVDIDLDKYFDDYLKELAKKLECGINGDINKVSAIEGCEWYVDPVYEVE